jgi:threonylcarbamoyladenosine tRNA methylthiotransferase MtaB
VDGVEIDEELFDLLASEERVMPHLHLSLQHGADLILKRMKRRHSRHALALVARLKARRDVAVGADIIAGFPTEDAEAHAANLSAIAEMDIVHGHIFPYSARPGTPAARMPQVAAPLIAERAAECAKPWRPTRRLAGAPCRHPKPCWPSATAPAMPPISPALCPSGMPAGTLFTPTRITEGLLA